MGAFLLAAGLALAVALVVADGLAVALVVADGLAVALAVGFGVEVAALTDAVAEIAKRRANARMNERAPRDLPDGRINRDPT